jgi:hypothetical protein
MTSLPLPGALRSSSRLRNLFETAPKGSGSRARATTTISSIESDTGCSWKRRLPVRRSSTRDRGLDGRDVSWRFCSQFKETVFQAVEQRPAFDCRCRAHIAVTRLGGDRHTIDGPARHGIDDLYRYRANVGDSRGCRHKQQQKGRSHPENSLMETT